MIGMPFCDGCGKQVSTSLLFCPECGRRLSVPPTPKKVESRTGVIVAVFLIALVLGMAVGSTFNPQLACAPCPKASVGSSQTMASSVITTGQVATDRVIVLSIGDYDRISTGDTLWFGVSTDWQGAALNCHLEIVITDPNDKSVYEEEASTAPYGVHNSWWHVPSNATLGTYTLRVVASKEGYISAQASDTFEVI